MRKTFLITAILLLSAAWMVAQTSQSTNPSTGSQSSSQSTSPAGNSSSQQPDTTQTSNDTGNSIEGCLGGSAGNWTLTDQSGKTWQLSGDTSKLADHAGHQVRIMGSESGRGSDSGAGGAQSSSGSSSGSQPTFAVKKVKMISSSCSTGK